jgi:multidrug efflux pump subunit AcrA (membrane-fusion protein)
MKISNIKIPEIVQNIVDRFPVTKRWGPVWGKRVLLGLVGIVVLFFILIISGSGSSAAGEDYAVVKQGDFNVDLVEAGDVEAFSQKLISAPMMWGAKLQVTDLVSEGTVVKQGDFLLQFDISDLEDTKKLREDQVESLKADLEKLKAQQALTIYNQEQSLQLAEYSHEQAKLRVEMRKFESQAKQEEARLDLKQAQIDMERVRKQLESQKIIHASQIVKMQTSINEAENRLESTVDRINRLQLHAPADGMVVYQQVRGERVKEGYESRPGWPLMSIPDLSRMQVKVYLNEVDRLKVRVGQEALINLEAYPDVEFRGKIREVSRLAQIVTGEERLKGFVIYIDIDGTDPKLKPGITAKVCIFLETLQDVMYAPVGCVFEVEGQSVVFPTGKTRPHAVYLGPRNDGYVVIEQGVKPGMKLSYVSPVQEAAALGRAEELLRIEETKQTLQESFAVFQRRGILHDYGILSEQENQEASDKPNIDLDKLPASIRKRLGGGQQEENEQPQIDVGAPEDKKETGTFRVTPDMMKRLERNKDSENQKKESNSRHNDK